MSLEPTWVVYFSVRLAGLHEEAFNPRRRGEGKQHPPGLLAEVSPHVRDVSWGQNRIARFQTQLRFADLQQHFVATFDEVKPFLLLVVNVSRWSAADHIAVLHDEQSAVGLVGEDLEVQMAVGTCGFVRLPRAISTCFDKVKGALFFVRKGRIRTQRKGSDYLQHRTTVELMHRGVPPNERCNASPSQLVREGSNGKKSR